jgi:hypothetical protein
MRGSIRSAFRLPPLPNIPILPGLSSEISHWGDFTPPPDPIPD